VSSSQRLILGAGRLNREIGTADELLVAYRTDDGLRYLDYQPVSSPDVLVPDDLAVTILINSRVANTAFKSVQDHGSELKLASLPGTALEDASPGLRTEVAEIIAEMASWKGLAASVATKVLHKKRPALIPILDNLAIFGAYMNPKWPKERSSQDSIYARSRIEEALEWIHTDLTRSENAPTWPRLAELEPRRSRIELFDMIWWMYFRNLEPVRPVSPL
jgi:hypothetical protein